ncbi:hypothetical protein [Pasteurella bettyae]|uniref:Uncharacterized protein n=1 Tax=Pasteurella bettyae CCUG 2042 TaxID=1095749 RepID=I3D9Y8_9PAST|nr:hypothetical protein [Pasteurella bettyae]EIJ68531.1 hypothetical protein HMPREF1052_1652 [Pasteurella bettyae CCUG 2042]SUB22743.1 Uncharacterised protein [Pasteurella bettyae]
MTTQSMILDCQELTCDLRDQIHALKTLDELLSSFNGREQIDSGGVARLIRAIANTASKQVEQLDVLLEDLKMGAL